MNRRSLVLTLFIMGGVAAIGLIGVVSKSMQPTAKAELALPRASTASIKPNGFAYIPHPWREEYSQRGTSILFLRFADGKLIGYYIPTQDGKPTVPISHPWAPGLPCDRFEPDFNANDIACRDSRDASAWVMRHRWSLQGGNTTKSAADLIVVEGMEQDGEFVLFKTRKAD
jgi:hypothetical protein